MNSYQKRKQEIEYYKQRCKNLEEVIKGIVSANFSDDEASAFKAYMAITDVDLPEKP